MAGTRFPVGLGDNCNFPFSIMTATHSPGKKAIRTRQVALSDAGSRTAELASRLNCDGLFGSRPGSQRPRPLALISRRFLRRLLVLQRGSSRSRP